MNRNTLYLVIGVLLALVVGLGIYLYQQQTQPALEIKVDGTGITVDGSGV